MASWEIFLFGTPRVKHSDQSLSVSRRKTVALLAYLAANPQPHSRETLAALMWPEHSAAQAKANLRRDLSRLKSVLNEDILVVDRTQGGLEAEGDWWLDVQAFQDRVQLIRTHNHFPDQYCQECLTAGQTAVGLYTADFMAGFTLSDSPTFDEWQFFTRESLRQSLTELLQRLIAWHTRLGEYEQAIEYGRRWLTMDSLAEAAHRELMRLYAWSGQQAAAVRQYQECVRLLEEELGVPPEAETIDLYKAIYARQLTPPEIQTAPPVETAPYIEPTKKRADRYEMGEFLAAGGHGEVYLAQDHQSGEKVVIKRIKPDLLTAESELLTRFQQEGEILARLNHPNIVRMLDTFQQEGQYHIVMEYVSGGSLRGLLNKEKRLSSEQAVSIALELADALSRAHHLSIVHRDLKPENILIAEDGTPRLTDFGVAYLKKSDSRITQTGTILGSPHYISPEIIQDEEELDGRSDIWSFGVVLYEMLAGYTPFGGGQVVNVLYKIINETETVLSEIRSDLPGPLVTLIHSMLMKDPAQRPASMRQIAAVLEAIREGRAQDTPATYLTNSHHSSMPLAASRSIPQPLLPPHFLPHQTTSFIGREDELTQIRNLLVEEASCRLLSLIGPGGIGKTRLAIEAANHLLPHFPDGVYFVPLASIDEVGFIIPAIAETLQLQFSGPATPKAQLIHYLRDKKMLIVADHLEQLLDGGQIFSDLLRLAPQVSFLVTVRERLQRTEEWSYEISGLSLPEAALVTDSTNLQTFSASQLFLKRASRARADFSLPSNEIPYLVGICRALECMPLGLELAAPWVRSYSVGEIAARIEHTLENLTKSGSNGSGKYLSLKAVFVQSWDNLSTAEKNALQRLTVFRGGWTREAAEAVAGASYETLISLQDKALIQQDGDGRFDLHNLVHQLANEHLRQDPEEAEVIYDIHCRYFLSYLEQQVPALKVDPALETLAAVTADMDNLRAAWEWAVAHRLLEELAGAAQGYWLFYHFRGFWYEGEAIFRQTADKLINAADSEIDGETMETLAGLIKVAQGNLMAQRGWLVEGIYEIETGLELMTLYEEADPALESFALHALGKAQLVRGQLPAARITAQKSLDLLPQRADAWDRLSCLHLLAEVYMSQGWLDTAEDLYRACLDICEQLGEQRLQLQVKIGMSQVARKRGSYGRAQQWLDECQELTLFHDTPLNKATILREQGMLALKRGQVEQSIELLEEAKVISEIIARDGGGHSLIYLGYGYHLQGDGDKANQLFRQSLATSKGNDYEPGIALALLHIGMLAMEKGRLKQAEQYIQDALVIWQDLENETLIARALQMLGNVTVAVGEARAADSRSYYLQALQLSIKHRLAPIGIDAIVGLVSLLARSGEVHQALRLLILAEQHPASSVGSKIAAQELLEGFAEDEVTAVRRETIELDWLETAEGLMGALKTAAWGQKPVHHNLPVHRSAFFGRQDEIKEIQSYLLETKCRLISIIGPGGIGKTRLAIATGASLSSHFPQGVFLIPLAPLETADQIYLTLAEILDLKNLVVDDIKEQLLTYLQRKQMLLIFDNYEHLLPQVDFIADIVEKAPNIQIIVTTRQRLNLGAEMVFTLKGMSYPVSPDVAPDKFTAYDAVQLLIDHAQLSRPDWVLEAEEYEPIVRICNLVQGMPLALVLAANWLDMLSFEEIADEIADSLDFLESERGDLPQRQRSVRAVFNGSWARLPEAAQATFVRLTVFRGGFSREAARAVCKTSLRDLRLLVNSSFVTVSASGRYEVHELMRQLGAEKLDLMGIAAQTKTDHSNFYLSFLQEREAAMRGDFQIEALDEILEDFDNIRLAWNWALQQGNREGIDLAQECLHLCFDIQGSYGEGREFFRKAKEALAPKAGEVGDGIYGRILTRYAFLGVIIGRPRDQILANLKRGRAIAIENDQQHEIAINYIAESSLLLNPEADLERLFKAKQILEDLGDDFYLSRVCISLSGCYGVLMNREMADHYIEEAARIARVSGSVVNLSLALANLSEIDLAMGRYETAQRHIEESLALGFRIHGWLLVAYCHCLSGFNLLLAGNLSEAHAGGKRGLDLAGELNHAYLKTFSLAVLSLWAGVAGKTEQGLRWGEESSAIGENNMMGLVLTPWGMALNLARLGRLAPAKEALVAAFRQAEAQSLPAPMIWLMGLAAFLAAKSGELETAVRFLSIAQNHPFGICGWMAHWAELNDLEGDLRNSLDPAAFERAWTEGAGYQEDILPPELLQSIYELFS